MNAEWISGIHREIKRLPVNVLHKHQGGALPIKMAIVTL